MGIGLLLLKRLRLQRSRIRVCPWRGRKDRKKKFATGLLLVSSRIFEKRRASCFTNPDLEENGAKSIEFIGVDGNGCVKASVLAATKEN